MDSPQDICSSLLGNPLESCSGVHACYLTSPPALQVSFEVAVEARSCPAEDTSHTFTIKPAGFRDTLEVAVTYSCLCGCTGRAAPASGKCSGNGTYACGLCECDPGYLGARCECEEGASGDLHHALCREAEGKPLCSGRGECSCNQCLCYESEFGNIYGPFCECDDFSCARYKGVLCSGRSLSSLVASASWQWGNRPEMGKVGGLERAGDLPCFWRSLCSLSFPYEEKEGEV